MHRANGGRQAALLLLAAGVLTLVNNYLPGSEHLDVATLNVVAVLALVAGAVSWYVPWQRLHPRAPLVLAPVAFALIGGANFFGGVSPYSYAVYFVVVFVWIGISQPPATWLLVLPLAVPAYVVPLLFSKATAVGGVASVTVAMPVCALVAETIARTVRRVNAAQDSLLLRAELSERLAAVVADVTSGLDPGEVTARACAGVRLLVGAPVAGFVTVAGGTATVQAVSGAPESLVGTSYPIGDGALVRILRDRDTVARDVAAAPEMPPAVLAALSGMARLVGVPSITGRDVVGALYAGFREPDRDLSAEESHALWLLAGHVGAALRTAEAHAELVRQQEHERAVIAASADGMVVVAADGAVRSWNAAAERIAGIPAEVAIGGPLPFVAPAGGEPVEHRLPDGRWLEIVASPLAGTGESVVSFRDISKPKALEEAKDLFLATTSHELRTPLTVIKGFTATLLNRWTELSEDVRGQALRAVAERTDSLISLVDHLMLGAKAGAGRHSLDLEPVLLGPLLERTVHAAAAAAPRHRLRLHLDGALPLVLADPGSLDHIVGQLLENAVKYSPDGGEIEVTAVPDGDGAVISVADRGVGLPAGTEATVFDLFYQAHGGDRRVFGGVGLGLHIVRTLVEAHGGTVTARNRPDGGAEFAVRLRAALSLPPPRAPGSGAGTPSRAAT